MRKMRRALALLLALGLVWGYAGAEDEEDFQDIVEVIELPEAEGGKMAELTVEEDPMIGPHEENYIYREGYSYPANNVEAPSGYADPSITVNVGWGRYLGTRYVYARVKIAQANQLRTELASAITSEKTVKGMTLAKRVNAVIAINGDYAAKQANGTVIRQGETLRLRSKGNADVLVIDTEGNFHILPSATTEQIEAYVDAVNVFTFGPGLVIDGVGVHDDKRIGAIGSHKGAQRVAICQTGELEYLLITAEGPEDEGSKGLTIDQFVTLIESFGDVQQAYNLDGGSCSTLVFRKNDNYWSKYNGPLNSKNRTLKDIIYFADAWIPKN